MLEIVDVPSPRHSRCRRRGGGSEAVRRRGATNNEIAAWLHLSSKTVETHLTRILGKACVRSRTELAYVIAIEVARPKEK